MTSRKVSRKMPPPITAACLRRWSILERLNASNYGPTVGEQIVNLRATGDPYFEVLADQIDGLVHVCATGTVKQINAYIDRGFK